MERRIFIFITYDKIKAASARSGRHIPKLGKWIVPRTKHYSWLKAADISGVGFDQVAECDVTDFYEIDMECLEKMIRELYDKDTFDIYAEKIDKAIKEKLTLIYQNEDF